ncbi:hypothetical protein [Pyrobaculum neutrophilum]|uniref:Uncharacterized protein n=1 Tax=Pyrobaculum neutrophilum (strain DSM 2338 / JCM 9278 / NBRC 100436 / V24Sta) TaxID=444157 RepID=B1Y9V0_PYRNV|nr:hypothetical protein [Pyrobaculum neutrophilum]ACB40500.1 conserved hypothetical protein [Pyrobaculum neutrophilum V24Sta]
MNPPDLGQLGEYIAEVFLKRHGYKTWRPQEFIRLLEMAAAYRAIEGECGGEPKEPITFSIPTAVGYVKLTYWRGRCLPIEGRRAEPLEYSVYVPCVKRCIEGELGAILEAATPLVELLAERRAMETVDLFAFKDGVFYAVEVKTNGGRVSETQREKAAVLRGIRHLLVRVYLQTPLVKIEALGPA